MNWITGLQAEPDPAVRRAVEGAWPDWRPSTSTFAAPLPCASRTLRATIPTKFGFKAGDTRVGMDFRPERIRAGADTSLATIENPRFWMMVSTRRRRSTQ